MKQILHLLSIFLFSLSIVSCESNFELSRKSISLTYQQVVNIDVTGVADKKNITWRSEDEFYAFVDNGKVIGNHVGNTEVVAKYGSTEKRCKVEIRPKYNLYKDPYCKWGASMTEVKNKIGIPDKSTSTTLQYLEDPINKIVVIYDFKNNKLSSVGVATQYDKATQFANHLKERYELVATKGDIYFFVNSYDTEKINIVVTFGYIDGLLIASYTDKKDMSSLSTQKRMLNYNFDMFDVK